MQSFGSDSIFRDHCLRHTCHQRSWLVNEFSPWVELINLRRREVMLPACFVASYLSSCVFSGASLSFGEGAKKGWPCQRLHNVDLHFGITWQEATDLMQASCNTSPSPKSKVNVRIAEGKCQRAFTISYMCKGWEGCQRQLHASTSEGGKRMRGNGGRKWGVG